MKLKFGLDGDPEIDFEDEQGAEIDIEVFPILLDQPTIPNIVFHLKGEHTSQLTINTANCHSNGSQIIYRELTQIL